MSKYTIELRKLCNMFGRSEIENWFKDYELTDYLTTEQIEIITNSDLWNKDTLARDIVDNYFMCEIGLETPALFKHYTKIYMRKIMSKKLPIIYSMSIKFDPLVNVDYTESYTRTIDDNTKNDGTVNSTSTNSADGLTVNSDTPQGQISKDIILQGRYASSTQAGESKSNVTDTSTTNANEIKNTSENYEKKTKGNSGISTTAQKLIEQYRNIVIGINEEIINELNPIFMGLY